MRGDRPTSYKAYYKALLIKAIWNRCTIRQTNQWKTDPNTYGNLVYDKFGILN